MPQVLGYQTQREGHELAARHVLGPSTLRARDVRRRLKRLDREFTRVFRAFRSATEADAVALLPSGSREWLLDNDFVVAEALENLRGALPSAFLARLPGLRLPDADGGSPRAEVLAREIVRRGRGRVEVDEIRLFMEGYQEIRPLRIAELWALPSLLRLRLLEDLLSEVTGTGTTGEVGPFILSLRTLAGEDWRGVVESLSHVEGILREDPAGIYPRMDFRSRDRYRSEVEGIARREDVEEDAVAEAAVELARGFAAEPREGHVGYYLVDEGRRDLFRRIGHTPPLGWIPSVRRRLAGFGYFLGIAVLTVLFLAVIGMVTGPGWRWIPLLLVAVVPALGVAVALANWAAGRVVSPRPLPRLDLRGGIPPRFRTVVAVPALLGSREDVAELLHSLETNYQGNADPELIFVLVTDFPDAATPTVDSDEEIFRAVTEGIRRLNERYEVDGACPFLLLHRSRRWNAEEGCWMGWERKRGKLAELNQLLLGAPSGLWVAEGDPGRLHGVPFVLTLDADTRLPRGAAARLVGTIAHPLNRPESGRSGKVVRGYSVLQPRIEILPDPDGGSLFSRVFGGIQGLDLYAHAAFDVYQDLFDVGIFAGKGIYDVRAFEWSLSGRTPENALLSHDLFEGSHGRAGFVSDLVLIEDFPGHPLAYARRTHRWIRGDWQILPWILTRVPGANGRVLRNRLSPLSRWMIFDNLRRSLHPISILLLLVTGWLLFPEIDGRWTLVLLAVMGLPFVIGTWDAALRALRQMPAPADLEAEGRALMRAMGRWVLDLTLLPFEAANAADAIVRTLHRVYVSRRRLLEWSSAAHTARWAARSHSPRAMFLHMRSGPVLAGIVAIVLLAVRGSLPYVALPILALWLLSPLIGVLVSRPRRPIREPRGEFPRARARSLARRVWGYYERFQGPETHWLAPDHYQEHPGAEVAHRTSPTNVGMAMVAAATAWDLGFATTSRFVTRIRNTVAGLEELARYRGHFLNWYDTSSLAPLHPLYVSTVDSGNLAASFLMIRETLRDVLDREVWTAERVESLRDTAGVLCEILAEQGGDGAAQAVLLEAEAIRDWIARRLGRAWDAGLLEYVGGLEELRDHELPKLEGHLLRIQETHGGGTQDADWSGVHAWIGRFRRDVEETLEEILLLFPWASEPFRGSDGVTAWMERAFPRDERGPTLHQLERLLDAAVREGMAAASNPERQQRLEVGLETTRLLLDDADRLLARLEEWYRQMDFSFLYDRRRQLFRIGFSVSAGRLDQNHYDLLASEARIASLVALSKGEAPPAHWLHLGRPFARTDRGPVLLSWAGTMFEYLMPTLFLRMPPDTVLEEACRRAVRVQRDHGKRVGIPWGLSESGYHVLSLDGHYQYRAFGVPQLGLRRVEASRVVVAPYASLMAVGLAPGATFANVEALAAMGAMGPWGPYEALDFGPLSTRSAEPRVVRSYMSHHHGMILAALGNYLNGGRLVERFHRDPRIATIEPYLHERIPWRRSIERRWVDRKITPVAVRPSPEIQSWSPSVDQLPPPVHHIASGNLVVAVGPDGRGGSRWGEWSIVRGGVGDGMPVGGPDLILLDRGTGRVWWPLPDPGALSDEDQEATFEPHRAEFVRKAYGIRTRMELVVPPRADAEVRRITIANEGPEPRHLRLALGMELALAPWRDDLRHPAFHKLFVRAEVLAEGEGVIFERRPRTHGESPPVLLVVLLSSRGIPSQLRWGTSREAFLGRGGNRRRPAALDDPGLLDGPEGPHHPLDPMACATLELDLEPWEVQSFTLLLAIGESREAAILNASELRSPRSREWARIQARARAEGELLQLGAGADDPRTWSELLAAVLHPGGKAGAGDPISNELNLRQSFLWRWGISGDVPFVLVEGDVEREAGVLTDVIRAQRWWKSRGQEVEVVVLGTHTAGYQDPIRERIRAALGKIGSEEALGRPGGVHLVPPEGLRGEERRSLHALAAVRLDAVGPALAAQIASGRRLQTRLGDFGRPPENGLWDEARAPRAERAPDVPGSELMVPSQFGGFDTETGEYVVDLAAGATTPAPWVNVIAREEVGFVVTESGGSFTWSEDAGEFRLTPWSNDPTLGLSGEVLYLRDEEDRSVWTPAPGPLGLFRRHRIRHGWGRTVLEATSRELDEEVSWFLHPTLPVKVVRVRLRNRSSRPRRISATFFADWVLGTHPSTTRGRVRVRFDADRRAVLARNPYSLSFSERVAFLASDGAADAMATDRSEFLGPAGPLDRVPAGLRELLPGQRVTPDGPPCGVLQRVIALPPEGEAEVAFFLGTAESVERLAPLLAELRSEKSVGDLLSVERERWKDYLSGVRVRTPEPALDPLLNGWLPYQTLTSRLRGRTGFYQSGGAFGYRDQLQDVYTLLPLDPALAVHHLQEAAGRQFREGDVLHWWHPGTTRGVRTRCSDDLLWLPWVLAQTVDWTGDLDLLDRRVPYLSGVPLEEGVDERYDDFAPAEDAGSLLEHAFRAVERTAALLSPRGLPLIGTGDWNDGMDRVGSEGRGESVWLGWFFLDVCRRLVPLARARGEESWARKMEEWSARVRDAVETHGWDGEWYRRAFFDDGTPIGSRDSPEARIDSIAQSWAVISGAGDPERARVALDSAWRLLVRPEDEIALLLTPPFTGEGANPGYIAAYPPGVRENGGQYTHAAAWLIRALARSGQGDRVGELLNLILPTRHAAGRGTQRYRVEPYVIAADVYGMDPHVGRGGWTWYTGSAGWVWRVVIEDVLGIRRRGDQLVIDPCLPPRWLGFDADLRLGEAEVHIRVQNPEGVSRGVASCTVNGEDADPSAISLSEAAPGVPIRVEATLGVSVSGGARV